MSDSSSDLPRTTLAASHALLSAALGGLLCLGTACSSSNTAHPGPASTGGTGGASTGGTGGSGMGGSGGTGGSATGGTGGSAMGGTGGSATGGTGGSATGGTGGATDAGSDASASDAAPEASASDAASDSATDAAAFVYCTNAPDAGTITSTKIQVMTEAEFQTECSSRGGTFEIMPHCGGYNSCMGMSYDTGTQTLTEHTCRGLNTCAGYSCVICN